MSVKPIKCFDPECTHPDPKSRISCTFFSFPTLKGHIDIEYLTKRGWDIALARNPNQIPSSLDILCSCHFEGGKKKNKPTLFTPQEMIGSGVNSSYPCEIEKELPSLVKIKKHLNTLKRETRKYGIMKHETYMPMPMPIKIHNSPVKYVKSVVEKPTSSTVSAVQYSERFKRLLANLRDSNQDQNVSNNVSNRRNKKFKKSDVPLDKSHPQYQRELSFKVAKLEEQNERLKAKRAVLEQKCADHEDEHSYHRERMTLRKLVKTKEIFKYYTGFKSESFIDFLVDDLRQVSYEETCPYSTELLIEDQVTLVMILLRRNYSILDLAFRFRISVEEVKVIVDHIVDALHDIFYTKTLEGTPFPPFPPRESLHDEFKVLPECRVILEAFQVECQEDEEDCSTCYNCFVGVSASKRIIYVSELFEADILPQVMFKASDCKDYLQSGDMVIADPHHFDIYDDLPDKVFLNLSQSLVAVAGNQNLTKYYSKARSLIGRTTMQYIRRNFILNSIPSFLKSKRTKIWQLCASLVNYQPFLTSLNQPVDNS